MTRSPDSLIPSDSGQPELETRDDKALTGWQEGEANLRAATEVNAVLQHRHIHPQSRQFSWSFSRGEPVPGRRSLLRTGR